MNSDLQRYYCLLAELDISCKLIKAGFGNLQEVDFGNDFYHLPHQLMASGLERFLKCYIVLLVEDRQGAFPSDRQLKALGHDVEILMDTVSRDYFGGLSHPAIKEDLDFLTNDSTLREAVRILSHFGKIGRYYNLDVVGGSPHTLNDPKDDWSKLESAIEDITPFLGDMESLYRDYYPRVHSKIIAKLERLVRAVARQFTLGDHADSKKRLSQRSQSSAAYVMSN